MKRVAVIGGGAAGMMAALTAANAGADVTLIEKNEKLGKKIYITGKGRCNVTNKCDASDYFDNVATNSKFLYSAVRSFDNNDLCAFFENAGLKLKVERGKRVFPVSDKASDVTKALQKECEKAGVKILLDTEVETIENISAERFDDKTDIYDKLSDDEFLKTDDADHNNKYGIKNKNLEAKKQRTVDVLADAIIIATGGLSYPSTGSTGDGYRFAEMLGHSIIKPIPSLVPLLIKEKEIKDLEGLSLRNVNIKISDKKTKNILFEEFGEMLFAADGVSGPAILKASSFAGRTIWEHTEESKNDSVSENLFTQKITDKNFEETVSEGDYGLMLHIDLKPALDRKLLDARILRDFEDNKNKELKNALNKLLPAKMIPVIINRSGILPEERVNNIKKEQRASLLNAIKDLTFNIQGLSGFDSAVITKGGVDVKKINPKTMESRIVKNIYFAGEVLDVDAYTGGFNLQLAFSTGRAAGLAAGKEEYETDSDRWTCRCRQKHNS